MMTRYLSILPILGLLCACSSTDGNTSETLNEKPNIIVIMADDLGYSDLGAFGSEIKTPNLDQLASDGVQFSQFYNGARCCPTRASLLTGVYAHQAGMGHMVEDRGIPAYQGEMRKDIPSVATLLKSEGYATYMTGKWHVTKNAMPGTPNENRPLNRGFDKYYGTLPGYGSLWEPAGLMEDSTFIKAEGDYYYTEAMSAKSCEYIDDAVAKKQPFFMYVAYAAPHYPLHAREAYIKPYEEIYQKGWDNIREERFTKLKELGIISADAQLPPRDELSEEWAKDSVQHWQARRMATFAAMVEQMDQGIGQIMQKLEDKKIADNTVILFLSDNGGSCEGHLWNTIERWGLPWKSKLIPQQTRDGRKVIAGDWPDLPLGADTTFGSYGVKWANVSNTPFRNHKSWMHEGGIRTGMIYHNPKSAQKGLVHQPGHIIDIVPTCLDLAGADLGMDTHLEGQSIQDIVEGKSSERSLYWEHEGNKAIRKGKWKLVSEFPGTWSTVRAYANKGAWELYDMEKDPTELHNRAQDFPELVEELENDWQAWADRVGVVNWPDLVKENY